MSRWQGWLGAVLETVAVLGVVAVLVRWCERIGWQWDFTLDRRYTLPAEAKALLRSLPEPVRIVAFVRSGIADPSGLLLWLPQLAREAPGMTVDLFDIDREPTRARQYGVDSAPTVVVESGNRRRVVINPGLPVLLSSIAAVVRPATARLAVVSRRANVPERRYARALEALRSEGFELAPNEDRGSDTSPPAGGEHGGMVVAEKRAAEATPMAEVVLFLDPDDQALPVLESVVGNGKGALLAFEAETCRFAPRLCTWLREKAQVEVAGGVLVDSYARLAAGDPYTIVATGLAADHPVTATLAKPVLLSQATVVTLTEDGAQKGWTLLYSSRSARLTTEASDSPGATTPNAPPFSLAVAQLTESHARLVVIGDADFCTDRFLDYLGNRDFLLNVAQWLAEERVWFGARVPVREQGVQVFFLSAAQAERLLWAFAVGEPLVLALLGLAVWWRRRRR